MSSTAPLRATSDVLARIRAYEALVGSDIHFAFQTIIDATAQEVVGFEALVRGVKEEPAALVMSRVAHEQRFDFDQACRIRALEAATGFGIDADVHLNCTDVKPGNVELVCQVLLHCARRFGIAPVHIVLELNNLGALGTRDSLRQIAEIMHEAGFRTLADNFGRRDADLRPIAQFRPDMVKLDYQLVRNIHQRKEGQAITRAMIAMCNDLEMRLIASGVEQAEEFDWLQGAGIELFQGYFFAQPGN